MSGMTVLPEDPEQQAAQSLAVAEDLAPATLGTARRAALDRLARGYEEHRRALAWFVARGDLPRAARMVRALRELWWERGRLDEGRAWVERVLAMPAAAPPTADRALVLDHAGALALYADDLAGAQRYWEACLALRRGLGLTPQLPVVLVHLGTAQWLRGDLAAARASHEAAAALARAHGNAYILRAARHRLAQVAVDQGALSEARGLLRGVVGTARRMGEPRALGPVVELFGAVEAQRVGATPGADGGAARRALRLASAGRAARLAVGFTFQPREQAWIERLLAPARRALDEPAQAAAWAEGQAMTLEQALTDALDEGPGESGGVTSGGPRCPSPHAPA
jgi:hypothetical protein